jgi:ATP-binding cassette subfamily C (CFTR/MRP) protein 1
MTASSGIYSSSSSLLLQIVNASKAKRLPYADHVITLGGDGKVLEQGVFKDLNAEGGYVASFGLPPPDWNHEPVHTNIIFHGKESVGNSPSQITEDDASRRTGDVAIYLYYVRAVGWIPTLVFVIAISAFVFCLSFPSTISQFYLRAIY